jgi:hypothetical protein
MSEGAHRDSPAAPAATRRPRLENDGKNRLVGVVSKAFGVQMMRYSYDVENRRVTKTFNPESAHALTTNYVLDGKHEIEERNGMLLLERQFVYGTTIDELLVMDVPGLDAANFWPEEAPVEHPPAVPLPVGVVSMPGLMDVRYYVHQDPQQSLGPASNIRENNGPNS